MQRIHRKYEGWEELKNIPEINAHGRINNRYITKVAHNINFPYKVIEVEYHPDRPITIKVEPIQESRNLIYDPNSY
jgi:hypothetical protein